MVASDNLTTHSPLTYSPMVNAETGQQISDYDLQPASLQVVGSPTNGSWSILYTYNPPGATGRIALWTNQKKTASFFPSGGLGSYSFYIEGTHESSALNDITLTFEYTVGNPPNQTIYSGSANITVTPLINTFGVTPNADAGDANKQNVRFVLGGNANFGLTANTPSGAQGALFKAVALKAPLSGDLRFIQNVNDLANGLNGTTNNAGAGVGWLYANGTSANWVLANNVKFPVLDFNPLNVDQTYALHFSSTLSPDGNALTITDDDAPSTGSPANPQNGVTVDVGIDLELYLVWRWMQTVGGAQVSVFYPLANVLWGVNFYAKGTVVNRVLTAPINKIVWLDGVTSGHYAADNSPPGALDPTRTFNALNEWQ